jgi:hypothetical protein
MYNPNQLQFPPDQFLVAPMPIDPQRPPIMFDIRCAPWLQNYVPWITGIMMDMITREAQGPVSIHFYNRMSQGNWNNPEFAGEVANCADFIYIQAGANQAPQEIPRYIQMYLALRSKFEVQLTPALRGFIAQPDQPLFDQAINQFRQIIDQILQIRGGGAPAAQQMRPAPQVGGYPAPVGAAPYGSMAPAVGGYQAQPQAGAYVPPGSRQSGGGRDYGSPAPAFQPPPQAPQAQPQRAPVAQAPVTAPTAAAPAPTGPRLEDLVDPDKVKWNPVPTMSPMLYNPVKVKMMYTLDPEGHTNTQLVITNMDPINYDRHNIDTLFGRVPANMPVQKDNAPIVVELKEAVNQALEESQEVDDEKERVYETLGLRNVIATFSLEEAILDARTEMEAKVDRDNRPMVFQAYAQIYTPIMGDKTEYELIRKLGESNSYLELREKLVAAGGTASPALLTDISLKLTNLMNEILRTRLSIPAENLEVEDFATDLDALFDALKKTFGENGDRIYRAFIKDQQKRIQAMFNAPNLDEESGRDLHASLLEGRLTGSWDDRKDTPAFTFFGPNVRITFINVLSHDLLIQGMRGLGNVITKQHSGVLYDLAVSLFQIDTGDLVIDRQYVVSLDGRVMEITQGLFVEPSYLLSLVK